MTAVDHVVYKLSNISLLTLLSLLWGGTIVVAKPNNGFSTQLIHIFSPQSPLYPGNISYTEENQLLLQQTNARKRYIDATIAAALSNNMSQTSKNPLDELPRLKLEFYPYGMYIVQLGLGTFDAKFPASTFKTYYLYTDTGSQLIWTLCEDCLKQTPQPKCFKTRDPPFPNSQSKTYMPLPCGGHRLCKPGKCKGGICSMDSKYQDGSGVRTTLGSEAFSLLTTSGRAQAIGNIVLGCAYDATADMFGAGEDYKVSGMLGLGYNPISFPNQISHLIDGAFSFCLTRRRDVQTYLRFGSDIPQPLGGVRVTPLVLSDLVPYYHVNLKAISVDGHKLLINPTVFEIRKRGTEGGCIIDNGSSFTLLINPAHKALVMHLEYHFMRYPSFNKVLPPIYPKFELCYNWSPPPREANEALPTITFHFDGPNHPNIDVAPESSFILMHDRSSNRDILCLAFVSDDVRTIFGSWQLSDYRYIFDLKRSLLKFAPEDCAKNS
ncbi:hypothetical protein ACFX1X_031627 [Malus domestica]